MAVKSFLDNILLLEVTFEYIAVIGINLRISLKINFDI